MRRGSVSLASALLIAALALPAIGCASGRYERREERRERRQDRRDDRVYDAEYRDYHRWGPHEEDVFAAYLRERRLRYRSFRDLSGKDQRRYWRWRHAHPEYDRR